MGNEYDVLDGQGNVVWETDEEGGWRCAFNEGVISVQTDGGNIFTSYAVQVAYLSDTMAALGISPITLYDNTGDITALESLIVSLVRKAKREGERLVESNQRLRLYLSPSILRTVNSIQ